MFEFGVGKSDLLVELMMAIGGFSARQYRPNHFRHSLVKSLWSNLRQRRTRVAVTAARATCPT